MVKYLQIALTALRVGGLYEEERFDIYLSGSNAFMLSSDLATIFGGRYFDLSAVLSFDGIRSSFC